MCGSRPASRYAHFPGAGFGIPVAQTRFKAFDGVVGEAYHVVAFDDADFVHVPAVGHVGIGGNLEGNLDGFAGVGAQVHDRARPDAAASGVVARREVSPGIGAVLDLDHAVAVAAELIPVPELEPRVLAGGGHHKWQGADQSRTRVGRVVAVQYGGSAIRPFVSAVARAVGSRTGQRCADFPNAVVHTPVVPDGGAFKVIRPDVGGLRLASVRKGGEEDDYTQAGQPAKG